MRYRRYMSKSKDDGKVTPRITIALPKGYIEKLQRYTEHVAKDEKQAPNASYLLQTKLDELESAGKIPPPDTVVLNRDDFEEIKKFIKLLTGKSDRNGISFAVLGELLDIDASELNNLYKLVNHCRNLENAQ
ncbi:hypothetical protein CAL7716_101270 (plasmid) [Calothrix sp. PCC 7716]|nr:hypothetical protein CAL7716_101270 [Calothrix sp. PCC 7716]